MVSIVDLSRFTRGLEPGNKAPGQPSLYTRQRETDVIKQAEEHGYFVQATRQFIAEAFASDADDVKCDDEDQPKDLSHVQLIYLVHAHLRGVGDVGMCANLRICLLSYNYISRIDGLGACENLMKLDLSHNQITLLPGPEFWADLHHLKILHLHDNPIGRIKSLTYLASAPALSILTLYDTPLALKKNYRHHAVNSLWMLKALDNYAVSDEEIIEDAEFSGYFSSFHSVFNVNLCPPINPNASYKEHLAMVYGVIASVNNILSRCSPVLIAQKVIRGFLVRRRIKAYNDTLLWAAVTIQRGFRKWKGFPGPHSMACPRPPSLTLPTLGGCQMPSVDATKMDYDSYLQNRRPGSIAHSDASRGSKLSVYTMGEAKAMSSRGSASSHERKNVFININKLQTGTLQVPQDDDVAIDAVFSTNASMVWDERHTEVRRPKKKKETEGKFKRIKCIKQFFGPVVKTSNTPEPMFCDDEDFPIIWFRLRGFKKEIQQIDPTTELILSRRVAGRDVRNSEFDYHMRVDSEEKPRIHRKSASEVSSLRRMLSRNQKTMGMSCLRAVQSAYKDREKMEHHASQLEYVLNMKEQREAARDRIKIFQEEKRSQVLKDRNADAKRIMEKVDHRDMQQFTYLEKSGVYRSKSSQYWQQRRGELNFMADFNIQNTSVSNALMRHDRQAVQEDKLQERTELVLAHKVVEKEQQDIVNKYLEHRQLMRQAEVAMSRAALDTKMLQEANDRLNEARGRVEKQHKSKAATIKAPITFPNIATPSLPPVSKEMRSALPARPILCQPNTMAPRSTTVA